MGATISSIIRPYCLSWCEAIKKKSFFFVRIGNEEEDSDEDDDDGEKRPDDDDLEPPTSAVDETRTTEEQTGEDVQPEDRNINIIAMDDPAVVHPQVAAGAADVSTRRGGDDLGRNNTINGSSRRIGGGIRAKHRDLKAQSKDLHDELKAAATAYAAACRAFYGAFIMKTTQDSIRTTLESIVKAKTRQVEQQEQQRNNEEQKNKKKHHHDEAAAAALLLDELDNISTAVKVFGDRQDVLAKQVDACHASFKAAREHYGQTKAKLSEIAIQLDTLLHGDDPVYSFSDQRMLSVEKDIQRQLRSLRDTYNRNQPPPPVTV